MGPGSIAERFAASLTAHTDQRLAAVGSRSATRSADFANRHGVARAHASYDSLLADPAVDIVYVATPTNHHHEGTLAALRAGKHVLVEKSLAENARQSREMVEEAQRTGLFIMEGMWPRFLPFMDSVRQVLEQARIGDPVCLQADLGGYEPYSPTNRMYSPSAGASVTLDRGVYLTALSSMLLGPPTSVHAVGVLAPNEVDAQVNVTLGNGRSSFAQLHATMRARTPDYALLTGTEGSIEFSSPWYLSPRVTLFDSSGGAIGSVTSDLRSDLEALCFEAAECARVIDAGGTQSHLMPPSESVSTMSTLDEVLHQVHSQERGSR
jgi:predicted dehydrogenase